MSNPKWFKYEYIWDKVLSAGHLNSKIMPMKRHENVLIFCNGKNNYNPQLIRRDKTRINKGTGKIQGLNDSVYGIRKDIHGIYDFRQPTTIINFSNADRTNRLHPTQKPTALLEYLIKTYTNEGETILDNCMGSGSTGVACVNTGRKFIGIEKDEKYFEIAKNRILSA
jgi:site-specific DNA-methyltransferase (adenine-specific)